MANELTRLPGAAEKAGLGRYEETPTEWDLPPEAMGYGNRAGYSGPVHDAKQRKAARHADAQAVKARAEGDTAFAGMREEEAKEYRQEKWDLGDWRTWGILFAMAIGFLVLVAICYYVPEGRHASPPLARFY